MFARSEEPFGVTAQAVLHDYGGGRRGGGGGGDGDGHGSRRAPVSHGARMEQALCHNSVPHQTGMPPPQELPPPCPPTPVTTVYVNPRAPVPPQLRIERPGLSHGIQNCCLENKCKSLSQIPRLASARARPGLIRADMRATANSLALVRLALVPQLRPAVRCCASTTGGVNGALQEVRGRLSSVVTSGSLSASVRI